jgi:proline iminopeptidase
MRVEAKGTRLWFDVDGAALLPEGVEMRERPTVVLLHGGPGSFDHSYFKPDFARLAEFAQVVYLDLLGHGRSDRGDPAAWTFDLAADAVRDFCDALDIGRPIVLGHSLGAFVAMAYAARHPSHPRALVLNGAFARFDVDRLAEEFRRAGGDEVAAIAVGTYSGERPATPEEWARVWSVFGRWVPGDVERGRTIANPELNAHAGALIRGFDVLDDLARIACPTLVIVGELDPITPVSAAREIVDAITPGRARLEIVEGAGHFTWRDAPDAYWPLLTGFVESLEQ